MLNKKHHFTLGVCLTLAGSMATACGAPDLGSMKPTSYKPSVYALLVDQPLHWKASDTNALAEQVSGVVIKTASATSAELQQRLVQAVGVHGLGMVIAIFNGAIPESAIQFATQHANIRFEFVGTTPAAGKPYNVRQIVTNDMAAAYLTGWLAGEMATQSNVQSIGFVPSTAGTDANTTQAMLAGVYDSDPTVKLVAVAPSTALPFTLPPVDVSNGPVAAADLAGLRSQHAFLASLDFGRQSPVELTLPTAPHVAADVSAYVHGRWQSGVVTTTDAPIVLVTSAVPAPVQKTFGSEANYVASNVQTVQAAWKALPKTVQAQWNVIAGS